MEPKIRTQRILRKVWYASAITLSALVLLLSAAGVIGTWLVERTLVDVSQSLLGAAAEMTGGLRRVVGQVDQSVVQVQQIASQVNLASLEVSQNIENKGLALTLLPAEQEQKLVTQARQIQDTLEAIRELLNAAIDTYQTINRLPLVNLPGPDPQAIAEFQEKAASTQASVEEMRQSVQDFRNGISSQVSRITRLSDNLVRTMRQLHEELTRIDQELAALADFILRVRQAVPLAFGLAALVISLLLAYVIYTQVELIRLMVGRWKSLPPPQSNPVVETGSLDPPAQT